MSHTGVVQVGGDGPFCPSYFTGGLLQPGILFLWFFLYNRWPFMAASAILKEATRAWLPFPSLARLPPCSIFQWVSFYDCLLEEATEAWPVKGWGTPLLPSLVRFMSSNRRTLMAACWKHCRQIGIWHVQDVACWPEVGSKCAHAPGSDFGIRNVETFQYL